MLLPDVIRLYLSLWKLPCAPLGDCLILPVQGAEPSLGTHFNGPPHSVYPLPFSSSLASLILAAATFDFIHTFCLLQNVFM